MIKKPKKVKKPVKKISHKEWLASLDIFLCPNCGKETIFKDECVECSKEN